MRGRYDDIIDMPHFQSGKRERMSMWNRAAQFAPFAALSGHDEKIEQTAREHEDAVEKLSVDDGCDENMDFEFT